MGGGILDPIDGPLGFIAEAIGLTAVLKVFGIETHNETFTDLQISNLLTPEAADAQARRSCKRAAMGNSMTYFKGYKGFQRDYRKKYSAQFMERQGYAPNSTATAVIATEAKTKTYLQTLYGYANVSVLSLGDRYLSLSEKSKHAVQQIAGYEFSTGQLVIIGNRYNNHQYLELPDDTQLQVMSTRLYEETIIQNLTDNYSYDGTYVYDGSNVYEVGILSDIVNVDDEYETVCTHTLGLLPDLVVLTPVERIVNVVTQAAYGTEASYASYRVLSGEVGTETRYWVDVANTQNIYDTTVLAITAIIPMKEDNVMVDTENRKLERMLRKLNLSGEQLKTSIENPDMDGAYLMMGINPEYNDDITNEVMFKMFDLISPGSGNINISISQLNMKYSFTITKSTVTGVLGTVGTYTRTSVGTGAEVVMTLKYQGDTNEYKQLVISGFSQSYTISGNDFTAYLDSTGGYCRLAIPLDLLNSLQYKKFVWIYERSLCMLAYSMQVVEVKWYETGAFGMLLKIVAIVITIWTAGAASSLYAMVVAMAKMVVIGLIVSYIAQQIGGVAGAIIGAIIGVILAGGMTSFDLSLLANVDVWMKMANQFISTMSQMQQHELETLIAKSTEELTALAAQTEELQGKIETDDGMPIMTIFDSSYAGTSNNIYQTTSAYCDSLISADVSEIVSYDLQMAYAIQTRSTVWSGP